MKKRTLLSLLLLPALLAGCAPSAAWRPSAGVTALTTAEEFPGNRTDFAPQPAADAAIGALGADLLRAVRTPGGPRTVLYLAPLCVRPDCRGQGIGAALVAEAFSRAAGLGYRAAFLVGDPGYYSRFGFRPVTEFGIQNCSQIPDVYVQAAELRPGALGDIYGELHLSA